MEKKHFAIKSFWLVFALISLIIIGCQEDNTALEVQEIDNLIGYDIEPIEGQYIVVLKAESSAKKSNMSYKRIAQNAKAELVSKFEGIQLQKDAIAHTYSFTINGFAARLDNSQLEILKKDSRIERIEQDYLVTLGKPPWAGGGGGEEEESGQETPWGISRVNGVASYSGSAKAWVIDSGIDLDHPDLNVDIANSASFLGGKDADDPNDANGHGTHVAGTIAAINNTIGVIGVAPGATVVSVRVLNRRGSGTYSGVINGVDYVAANASAGDVANMSLGGPVSSALDNAVIAASSSAKFILAAGNESDDADNHSPARANGTNIYTISAMSNGDNFASFSNYGSSVDYCAPGVSINSTWKNGGYNTISGTSMAAPHAAGVLLLGSARSGGTVNGDPDGSADTIIIH